MRYAENDQYSRAVQGESPFQTHDCKKETLQSHIQSVSQTQNVDADLLKSPSYTLAVLWSLFLKVTPGGKSAGEERG